MNTPSKAPLLALLTTALMLCSSVPLPTQASQLCSTAAGCVNPYEPHAPPPPPCTTNCTPPPPCTLNCTPVNPPSPELTPLPVALPGQLPPGSDYADQQVNEFLGNLSSTIAANDPTHMLPTPTSLRNQQVINLLQGQLGTYKSLFLSGSLQFVPSEEVSLSELNGEAGPLPTKVYYQSMPFSTLGLALPDPDVNPPDPGVNPPPPPCTSNCDGNGGGGNGGGGSGGGGSGGGGSCSMSTNATALGPNVNETGSAGPGRGGGGCTAIDSPNNPLPELPTYLIPGLPSTPQTPPTSVVTNATDPLVPKAPPLPSMPPAVRAQANAFRQMQKQSLSNPQVPVVAPPPGLLPKAPEYPAPYAQNSTSPPEGNSGPQNGNQTNSTKDPPRGNVTSTPTPPPVPMTDPSSVCDVPGPDSGGYQCVDTAYSWQNTVGGNSLSLTDDSYATVALPFLFTWYGSSKSTAYIGSNGLVCFNTSCTSYTPAANPNGNAPNDYMACLWRDLNPGVGGTITYKTVGNSPNRIFTIEYNAVPNYSGGGSNTFQILLLENGEAKCMYSSLSGTSLALAGTENAAGNTGVRYRFSTFSAPSYGVRFYTSGASPPPPSGGVTVVLYQHCNYAGWQASFGTGTFNLVDLQSHGGTNDATSAVVVGSGLQVTLYQHDYQGGSTLVLGPGSYTCLVDYNFNDLTSSLVVTGGGGSGSNVAPNTPATPSGPTSGYRGTYYSYSTSATDPNGDQVKYTFDWGDGYSSTTGIVNSGSSASASHAWTNSGTYLVRATAYDYPSNLPSGSSGSLSVTITVPPSPPATPGRPSGPTSVSQDIQYSYSTSSTDPNGDRVRMIFNWGDGTTSTTGYANSGATISAPHTWVNTGTYTVSAYAEDETARSSGWSSSLTVSVIANQPPATPSRPSGPTTGSPNQNYGFTTSSSDPEGESVRYLFDWGDGQQTWTDFYASGAVAAATHSWTSPGTFQVKVLASDRNTGAHTSSWSSAANIAITNAPAQQSGTTYSQNFDGSSSGWSVTGFWHTTSQRSYTASNSLWYGQDTTAYCSDCYDNGQRNSGTATSPTIQVPLSHPLLTFHEYHDTEGLSGYDRMWVRILSTSGQELGYSSDFAGAQNQWNIETVDLSKYAGQSVKLEFNFDTRDHWYNDYEGWYIDDITVSGGNNQPQTGAQTLTIYSTDWYAQRISGTSGPTIKQDDDSAEWGARIDGSGDHVTKVLQIHVAPGASYFQLWIHGKSFGCNGNTQYTHSLAINQDQPQYVFDPCSWSSSYYGWQYFRFPMSLLKDGLNTFKIAVYSSGARGMYVGIDSSGQGSGSDIVVDNTDQNGEALIQVRMESGSSYDVMSRDLTYQYTDANRNSKYEYGQESYVFFSPLDRDMLFVRYREDTAGNQYYIWGNSLFRKNENYNDQTRERGLEHWTTDEDGVQRAPTTGQYYTWFDQEWGSHSTNSDTVDQHGHFMNLVPAVPDRSSEYTHAQNPPRNGRNGDSYLVKISLELYQRTIDSNPCWNKPCPETPGHTHQEFKVGIHFGEFSEYLQDYTRAMQLTNDILEAQDNFIQSMSTKDFLKKEFHFGLGGGIISWIYDVIQTGDAVSLRATEKDYVITVLDETYRQHWTIYATVPSLSIGIGPLSIDPQLPIQIMHPEDNFDHTATITVDRNGHVTTT